MPLPRSLLLALSTVWVVPAAQAIGFASPPAGVTMGSPLDVTVGLRLDDADAAEADCVRAEAQFGDRRLPPHLLRWAVEAGADRRQRVLRVQSLSAVDEPVVMLQLTLGCTTQVTRRFTVFADPPLPAAALPPVLQVAPAEPPTRDATGTSAPAASPTASGAAARRASAMPAATPQAQQDRPAARPGARTRRAAAPGARSARVRQPSAQPTSRAAPTAAATPRAPRLALEAPDPTLIERAVAAAVAEQQAAAASQLAAATATAASAAERTAALDAQLQRLLTETQQQREQLQQLRAQAAGAQAASRALPWMGAALAVLVLLAGWLALRLRQARRDAHDRWWADATQVLADARPDTARPTDPPGLVRPAAASKHAGLEVYSSPADLDLVLPSELDAPDPPTSPTLQAPVTVEPAWVAPSALPRAVSAEELFDLDQQAEFFIVLGQDEAAIDLLVGHLRDSGGLSPQPYLKLLEIYRRRGDAAAYERTRSRFNQRFNAYAPDWDTDARQTRTLADYPAVLQRLQAAWPTPIDAMAELETLLYRKDAAEQFELPAYRELLLLHSMAHELLHQQSGGAADVDLLLPLSSAVSAPVADALRLAELPVTLGEATIVLGRDDTKDRNLHLHEVDLDIGAAPTRPDADIDLDLDEPSGPAPLRPPRRA